MITRIRIQNYRSFVDAEVKLRPFSLVVGANGSGKSNLMKFFATACGKSRRHPVAGGTVYVIGSTEPNHWRKHSNLISAPVAFEIDTESTKHHARERGIEGLPSLSEPIPWEQNNLPIFNLSPLTVASPEKVQPRACVQSDGSGTAQVLDMLRNGDREDLFDLIEANLRAYVPEVEKLSLQTVSDGAKQIQIREKAFKTAFPATELSEGTRLVLCILTILHQENPPPIILLEDIDRGLHPRLFEYVAPMMKDIAERHNINILATTHNPYLVDCFQDDKEAVIIVEKKDGASTLSTLADRLDGLDYDKEDPEDMPLGNLWFSGLVGGVPAKINRRPAK